MAELARARPGTHVLDIACGTGAATFWLPDRVGTWGRVVGLDASADMLALARARGQHIEWVKGRAEALPFPDASFDAVVSQFGLMFFDDRPRALAEMWRVLRPSGHLAVAVWDRIERAPGYAALARVLDELFEPSVGRAFRAPFALGDVPFLLAACARAGIRDARVDAYHGSVRFPSLAALLRTETLAGLLDEAQLERLHEHARRALAGAIGADGALELACPALVVTAKRP